MATTETNTFEWWLLRYGDLEYYLNLVYNLKFEISDLDRYNEIRRLRKKHKNNIHFYERLTQEV